MDGEQDGEQDGGKNGSLCANYKLICFLNLLKKETELDFTIGPIVLEHYFHLSLIFSVRMSLNLLTRNLFYDYNLQ